MGGGPKPVFRPRASIGEQRAALMAVAPDQHPPAWDRLRSKRLRVHPSSSGPTNNEHMRKRGLVDVLWGIVDAYPSASRKTAAISSCPASVRHEFVGHVKDKLASYSLQALGGAVRTRRRYLKFLSHLPEKPMPLPTQPAIITVFLAWVAAGDDRTLLRKPGGKKKAGGGWLHKQSSTGCGSSKTTSPSTWDAQARTRLSFPILHLDAHVVRPPQPPLPNCDAWASWHFSTTASDDLSSSESLPLRGRGSALRTSAASPFSRSMTMAPGAFARGGSQGSRANRHSRSSFSSPR